MRTDINYGQSDYLRTLFLKAIYFVRTEQHCKHLYLVVLLTGDINVKIAKIKDRQIKFRIQTHTMQYITNPPDRSA